MSESLVARWLVEESTIATRGLGGGERLADGSATVLEVTVETDRSSGADARAIDAALAFGAEGSMASAEQMVLPEASEGVVGHAIRPPSPQV